MDNSIVLELYKLFRQENSSWLTSHRDFSQQYFTLVIGILGASIVAASQLTLSPQLMLVVLIAPFLNIFLCRTAIKICDRAYQAYLEAITIQAKLEPLIGLVGQRPKSELKDVPAQFPKDENLIPERWFKSRQFSTADEFVKASINKGSNRVVRQTFWLLAISNGLLAVGIATFSILKLLGRI